MGHWLFLGDCLFLGHWLFLGTLPVAGTLAIPGTLPNPGILATPGILAIPGTLAILGTIKEILPHYLTSPPTEESAVKLYDRTYGELGHISGTATGRQKFGYIGASATPPGKTYDFLMYAIFQWRTVRCRVYRSILQKRHTNFNDKKKRKSLYGQTCFGPDACVGHSSVENQANFAPYR